MSHDHPAKKQVSQQTPMHVTFDLWGRLIGSCTGATQARIQLRQSEDACRRKRRLQCVLLGGPGVDWSLAVICTSCLCRDKAPAVLLSGDDGQRWALESPSSPGQFLDFDTQVGQRRVFSNTTVQQHLGLMITFNSSVKVCCLQGSMVLGPYEGGGWVHVPAEELLESSTSQRLRLTVQGTLSQASAGSTGESQHESSNISMPEDRSRAADVT